MFEPAIRLRHELHRYPELSGKEQGTARRLVQFFSAFQPDSIIEQLGGNGVAVVFRGKEPGPTILLRAEMDGLPITETIQTTYCSSQTGVAHKCGHDGHMAILAAVGCHLAAKRPHGGTVVLLFQPAEESGMGANAVLRDAKFAAIRPHSVFALHNIPGLPLGELILRKGTFACASRGMVVGLHGLSAHAAQPDTGRSPALAVSEIVQQLTRLPQGIAPAGENAFVTVVGVTLGEKAFGIAPGRAEIWATLRSEHDATMAKMIRYSEQVVQASALAGKLDFSIGYEDIFSATVNSSTAVDLVRQAHGDNPLQIAEQPFRWSEDFGQFTARFPGALFGMGAGTKVADLHQPEYDFPDMLIPEAARLFMRLIGHCPALGA